MLALNLRSGDYSFFEKPELPAQIKLEEVRSRLDAPLSLLIRL